MNKLLPMVFAFTLISSFSYATIRRVGRPGNPVANVDYPTFSAAHNAAIAGDTIYLYTDAIVQVGSIFEMNKRLVVIGVGYFLNTNTGLNAFSSPILGGDIRLISSASGSTFIGISLNYLTPNYNNSVNDITVIGCRFRGFSFNSNANCSNWVVKRCFWDDGGEGINSVWSGGVGSITVENSIINRIRNMSLSSTGIFSNCLFLMGGPLELNSANFLFQNCVFILRGNTITGQTNSVFTNNLFNGSVSVTGTNNIYNVNENSLFVGWPTQGSYSLDSRWQLQASSPAKGAGINGVDCGIFGGTNPYRLSGIPPIPTIYSISSPQGNSTSGNTVQINLSTRSNN
jgi:hypothetical protein